MTDIGRIINAIDEFLEKNKQITTTPPEINSYLEKKGLLKDSKSRSGSPIRNILRKGEVPHAYQDGVNWFIPKSGKFSIKLRPINKVKTKNTDKTFEVKVSKDHKLTPIGNLILKLIEEKYNKTPDIYYEYKPNWLLSNPTEQLIKNNSNISDLYNELTDNSYLLKERIVKLTNRQLNQKQSVDIWIGEPLNFAVEFDESQHFNQFRKITLNYYSKINIKYPIQFYKELNNKIEIKPGNSGFTRLKSFDPLFPEMLVGEKQDNRIRQRAFRDFLKDLLPLENGFNPTLRIPYHITNNKRKDFTEIEIDNIKSYIKEYDLI